MTNLSNAAYAVFTAYNREASGKPEDHHMLEAIAAALRAAAVWSGKDDNSNTIEADDLFAIAAELEEFGNR